MEQFPAKNDEDWVKTLIEDLIFGQVRALGPRKKVKLRHFLREAKEGIGTELYDAPNTSYFVPWVGSNDDQPH